MLKTWFLALRPWSFTAAAIPVTVGTILAWNHGCFNIWLFLLILLCGIMMQAGTNLINTYGDFKSGVDTCESAINCPQLVQGILNPEKVHRMGIAIFIIVALIGLYFIYLRGWPILLVGLLGIIGGHGYTEGISYKYKGLGSVLVFFLMGPMMVWGTYFMQTGYFSWQALWIALPVGFLVSAILHANDLRDIPHDKNANIKTLAIFMGRDLSFKFYYVLNMAAYMSLIILVLVQQLPITALMPLLLIPQIWKIFKNTKEAANGNFEKLKLLEVRASQFHFKFGLVLILGMFINLISKGGFPT